MTLAEQKHVKKDSTVSEGEIVLVGVRKAVEGMKLLEVTLKEGGDYLKKVFWFGSLGELSLV